MTNNIIETIQQYKGYFWSEGAFIMQIYVGHERPPLNESFSWRPLVVTSPWIWKGVSATLADTPFHIQGDELSLSATFLQPLSIMVTDLQYVSCVCWKSIIRQDNGEKSTLVCMLVVLLVLWPVGTFLSTRQWHNISLDNNWLVYNLKIKGTAYYVVMSVLKNKIIWNFQPADLEKYFKIITNHWKRLNLFYWKCCSNIANIKGLLIYITVTIFTGGIKRVAEGNIMRYERNMLAEEEVQTSTLKTNQDARPAARRTAPCWWPSAIYTLAWPLSKARCPEWWC